MPTTVNANLTSSSLIPAIYHEDPLEESQPDRVHVRGVDDFHTNDIIAFANEHFPTHPPSHIQWIDDTSANIIYPSSDFALQALLSFTKTTISADQVTSQPFILHTARQLASRPASYLQVRLAKVGDRKKKGAKDASRYYLLHPEMDPRERMKQEFSTGRRLRRDGDHGDYQRRRYDDREHRRRRDKDADGGAKGDFAASMYDDAPSTTNGESTTRGRDLFARTNERRQRNRSASPGRSTANSDEFDISDEDMSSLTPHPSHNNGSRSHFRDRSPPPRYSKRDPNPIPANNASKELFPVLGKSVMAREDGKLHSDNLKLFPASNPSTSRNNNTTSTTAARRIATDLFSDSPRPGSPRSNHKRSNAISGSPDHELSERLRRNSLSDPGIHAGRNGGKELFGGSGADIHENGLNIKGSANLGLSIKGSGGLSIKGAANVKELFPEQYKKSGGTNEGKELFDSKIKGRGERRRNRAVDYH